MIMTMKVMMMTIDNEIVKPMWYDVMTMMTKPSNDDDKWPMILINGNDSNDDENEMMA